MSWLPLASRLHPALRMVSDSLERQLDRLAAIEPVPFPVLSLYLDARADQHGRETWDTFLKKEFRIRASTYPAGSPERESFDRDCEKISAYLKSELEPASNGVAVFACSAAEMFEAVQTKAPFGENRLLVYNRPNLYTLARLVDQNPRYAAVLADTTSARIFVFGFRSKLREQEVTHEKVRRTEVGGWSQARYQRHVDELQAQHVKDMIEALDRIVTGEKIDRVVLAGDEVVLPIFREHLPKRLAERLVDTLRMDVRTPEHEVLAATLEAMREHDARTDAEVAGRLIGEVRAGGLAVGGPEDAMNALRMGQADLLVISASILGIRAGGAQAGHLLAQAAGSVAEQPEILAVEPAPELLADTLVALARQTKAGVRFIEEANLLAPVGGVGAFLRYRVA